MENLVLQISARWSIGLVRILIPTNSHRYQQVES